MFKEDTKENAIKRLFSIIQCAAITKAEAAKKFTRCSGGLALSLGVGIGGLSSQAFSREFASVRLEPKELDWRGLQEGVQYAPISGNEHKGDMYVYRVTFPKGHKSQPHFHTDQRVITILQGSLYVGYGDVYDESKLKRLPEGSVFTEPKNTSHFVWAKDERVLMQVTGSGGSQIIYPAKALVVEDVTLTPGVN
ncbi:MAG TPA: cupin domain-containing protein [Marinagarivorans sp.]